MPTLPPSEMSASELSASVTEPMIPGSDGSDGDRAASGAPGSAALRWRIEAGPLARQAERFVQRASQWHARQQAAARTLQQVCAQHSATGARAVAIVARDALGMAPCAIVFNRDPGEVFLPAPAAIGLMARQARPELADSAAVVCFPDSRQTAGRAVMAAMAALARVNEARPLLGLPGVLPAGIARGQLVLSSVRRGPEGFELVAAQGAITEPGAFAPAQTLAQQGARAAREGVRPEAARLEGHGPTSQAATPGAGALARATAQGAGSEPSHGDRPGASGARRRP